MSVFFSIIIATRNVATILPCLLESLADQSCRDFEVLIQDCVSHDDTVAVAESFRVKLPAFSLISEPDAGIYDAWNKALSRIHGKWVLFLGADDALATSDVLANVQARLLGCPENVLFAAGTARFYSSSGDYRGQMKPQTRDILHVLRREMPVCHTAVFHAAKIFSTSLFDPEFMILGDYDFFCRMLHKQSQCIDIEFIVTDVTMGGVSSSIDMQPKCFFESIKIQRKYFSRMHPKNYRIWINIIIIILLVKLFGKVKTSIYIDKIRNLLGKEQKWTIVS